MKRKSSRFLLKDVEQEYNLARSLLYQIRHEPDIVERIEELIPYLINLDERCFVFFQRKGKNFPSLQKLALKILENYSSAAHEE